LHRRIEIALQLELDHDLRDALHGVRAQLVDSAYRVDRLLERLGDPGLGFLGRRAGQSGSNHDGRHVDLGKQIYAEAFVREPAQDFQYAHKHGGEDRAAHAEVGDDHDAVLATTGVPSARRSTSLTITRSPGLSPSVISI